ncbi:periplasmic protease [Nostoc sp. PCC 7524]|uniref:PDZ domain-containing protein n=1 Tax=Nostoc sp. (strain ATCC 29411 / PCC 7524) TaxID=28072 RepID=UPI00029F0A26|nr:PDZ domain-containing protein [Nostoc sp. PCC 7524]AFY51051.1 periplasmic protease [Nostoc sp. PCC 7524]
MDNNIIRSIIFLALLFSFCLAIIKIYYNDKNHEYSSKDVQELTQSQLNKINNTKNEKYIVGIGISFKIDEKTKIPTITDVFKKSPADTRNLKVGDQILAVDGKSTVNMSSTDVTNLIRGDVNTVVSLRISRPGRRSRNVRLIRQRIINTKL